MADFNQIRKAYRIFSWLSLVALVITIVLVLRKSPPPKVHYDANAAAKVEQEFLAAGQAADSGQPAQVQIDRTELNSYLKKNLQLDSSDSEAPAEKTASTESATLSPAASDPQPSANAEALPDDDQASLDEVQSSVKDVNIDMDGDLVKAYVTFNFHGKDLSLELDGHLGSENGYIKFDPVAGKLGSLPLPMSALQSAVQKMMNSPDNREKLRLPEEISDIHIADGQAVISYK